MRTVSADFLAAVTAPVKEVTGRLVVDATTSDYITSADDLIKFTVEGVAAGVGKSVMRKLTATYLGTRNLIDKEIQVEFGVMVSGAYEYVNMGSFLISTCEVAEDKGSTTITAYDLMIYTMTKYDPNAFTYPTTVGALYTKIASLCGLEVETAAIPFASLAIDIDLYANISGTQYRNIIEDIAILGGQIAIINEDGELALRSLKTPTNTVKTLTYAELKKFKLKGKYGEVNSLVLSRQPQEDNVALQDTTSIDANGLTEIKIANNEIIDKQRETVATDIFGYYDGLTYYPFEATTIGLGYFELGDKHIIQDNDANAYQIRIMSHKLTVDGSLVETIMSSEPTKTQTNYAIAGGLDNRVKNTEIIVDKQNQQITSVVSDVATLDDTTTENFSRIDQNLTDITQAVQTTGGINLLRNSAFYQTNPDGTPTMWTPSGSGTYSIQASPEAGSNGSLSANTVTLTGVTMKQKVTVVADTSEIDEANKTYYSFKVLVKKGSLGTLTVKVYNDTETHTTTIPAGTIKNYDEVSFEALLPTQNFYWVELTGDASAVAVFTDSMFSVGKYPSAWQQANGEILNTNVNINENGIIVKSSVFAGDYTAITPLEFSGYSKIGSTLVKAFTLNKDQTQVKKLYASDEMAMPPIKIVPITTGSVTGWAFVKRSS